MDVGFTEDQLQFRDVVSRFLTDKSPPAAVRTLMETAEGYDPEVWQQLSQEVGLLGTHIPEQYGGFGFGLVELGLIAQEMGRHLYCGPFFSSAVMAANAILLMADEVHKQALLPSLAAGTSIACLVLDSLASPEELGEQLQVQDGHLSGQAELVVDVQAADTLIVLAGGQDGLALFAVTPDQAEVTPLQSMDATRKLARVAFTRVPVQALGQAEPGQVELLWDQMATMLAHEMIGGAEHLFESTIDYMKIRVQFGRTIGSFQALKHRCADLMLELELAKAMTHAAGRFLAGGEGDVYSPNMAKALASEAYLSVAKQAIQLRGGIGFTWEEDTHLWFKRAKSSEVFLGTAGWHRERMIQRLEEENAHV
ncbi:MAG: acyl-CoA dehydrogenase family protein [Pseudomonadota bacterium]